MTEEQRPDPAGRSENESGDLQLGGCFYFGDRRDYPDIAVGCKLSLSVYQSSACGAVSGAIWPLSHGK
jgi:hypothetical protein